MPTYSTAGADLLAANIMRSLQPKEPESSEISTGKPQSESGHAAFPSIAAPIPSTPVVQSQEIGIQRQCSECAKEQSTEEGKDIDEISAAVSGIQTKLTIGAPPNPYQQAANQMAEVMSKPILYAPMPQVPRFSPEASQLQRRAASAQSISPMMQMSVEQQAQMSALIQRTFRGEGTQASFEPVQAKLTVGEPGDKYEQEADAVARTVVEKINAPTTEPSVQRQSEVGGASELNITVMRHSKSGVSGGESVTVDVEQGIQQARGGGQRLDESVRGPMEGAFGADFSGVRVHTDANSDVLNRSISARAFTTGQDIFFKQGEYNPGSRGGQELLAHELTHVVQQTGGIQAKFSNNDDLDKNLNKEEQKVSQMSFQDKLIAAMKLSLNLLKDDAKNALQQLLNDPQFVAELIAVGAIFAALQAVPLVGQAIDAALILGLGFQAGYSFGKFLLKVWQAKDKQGLNAAAVEFKNLVEAVGVLALTGVLKLAGRILRAIRGGGQTAAVWNAIKATDVVYEGTLIPRSFELSAGNKKFWVAPNATEHLFDELRGYIRSRGSTQDAERFTQFLLDDFRNSVTEATKKGITYNQEIRVGIWEFVFGRPRQPGQLPVIFHAEPQGNIQIPR
jgi:hypothetical protein